MKAPDILVEDQDGNESKQAHAVTICQPEQPLTRQYKYIDNWEIVELVFFSWFNLQLNNPCNAVCL